MLIKVRKRLGMSLLAVSLGFAPARAAAAWTSPGGERIEDPAAPDLDAPFLPEGFDENAVMLPGALRPIPGRFQPMIQEGETGYVPSEDFLAMAPKLADMNWLAYKRGQDYRYGHELTLSDSLSGWILTNFTTTRGLFFADPNAGFVAYNPALNTLCILFHGSINEADWITNFASVAVRFDTYKGLSGAPMLPMVGRVHLGFLDKYLSCRSDETNPALRTDLMGIVDRVIAQIPPGKLPETKYYVSGHSQGAVLGQLCVVHLCQHLRKHYPDFNNKVDNRVHAWLLACPVGMDRTAAAFAEEVVGKRNIFVQNTGLDPVPNLGFSANGVDFKSLGTHGRQGSAEAVSKAMAAHVDAVTKHLQNGDLKAGVSGAMPARINKAIIAALHMATDNVNYRGPGASYAFDPKMVARYLDGINAALQRDFDYNQRELQNKAAGKKPARPVPAPAVAPAKGWVW